MRRVSMLVCTLLFAIVTTVPSEASEESAEKIEALNQKVVRQAHASLAEGDFDTFKSLISPNYTRHCQAMPPGQQELHGTEIFFAFLEEFVAAVPGYTDTLSNMIAEGDRVAYISTMIGTQTGPMGGFPATGESFTLVNIIIQRLEDGKIVETWVSWDNMAFLSQLGLLPDSAGGSPN